MCSDPSRIRCAREPPSCDARVVTALPDPTDPPSPPPSDRSTVKRAPSRARYDRAAVHAVLDAGWLAHVGLVHDGEPVVLPMAYARLDDELLLHASVASRLARTLAGGGPVCVTVTHLDGLVLARSAFHHSVNYRSVVIRGVARRVTDPDELARGFARLVDQVAPGRSAEVRAPDRAETRQTALLALPIVDAAVKSRTGDPIDEPDDLDLPVWAGVVPLALTAGAPIPSADLRVDRTTPPTSITLP